MNITASNSYTIRLQLPQQGDAFSTVLATISKLQGQVGAIDIIKIDDGHITRDITIDTFGEEHAQSIYDALSAIPDVVVRYMSDRTFMLHLGGKIEVTSKVAINHRDELSMVYTPGVARVCKAIHAAPEKAFNLTIRRNCVAVVTDGSAVLGLGNIGSLAALPVMEGKAMLFKKFANVDAFPICLATQDTEEVIRTVQYIAPTFGAINLEDIASPRCFEIERRLKEILDIPVFHDDQHGTAAVLGAALINALKIVDKKMENIKVVFNGVGAAGTACTNILLDMGVKNIVGCDRQGAIYQGRDHLDDSKKYYAAHTNPDKEKGDIHTVIKGADVFVGLSAPNILTVADLNNMQKDPIVFAMANPDPEITPELARPHVAVMATGRSDYPNQINNVLAFPGIFRGALDCHASDINSAMKLAAAYAIANCVDAAALSRDYIIPSVFNAAVAPAVAEAVITAARETGVARR